MRHKKKGLKIGSGKDHRRLLIAGLVISLIAHKQIKTTLTKAKVLKSQFDKLVTLAKKGNLHSYRLLVARLGNNKQAAHELVHRILPRLAGRQSGYTTIKRLGQRRGDNAMMAQIKILLEADKDKDKKAKPAEPVKTKKATSTLAKKSTKTTKSKPTKAVSKAKTKTGKVKSRPANRSTKSGGKDAK